MIKHQGAQGYQSLIFLLRNIYKCYPFIGNSPMPPLEVAIRQLFLEKIHSQFINSRNWSEFILRK